MFLNVLLLLPGAGLRVWQLPFSSTSQRNWWQNTAMPWMAEGNRTDQRKIYVPAETPEKGAWKTRSKTRLLAAAALSAAGEEAGLRDERRHPKVQIPPTAGNQTCALLSWSLCQRNSSSGGRESSEGLRESLTHTEDSSNVQVKMMMVLNIELWCQWSMV